MPRAKLQEILNPIPFEILEWKEIEEGGAKKFRVKGVFNRADERNANERIYPSKLMEREHKKLQERLSKQNESTFMQADHPADGVSRVRDTAGIMRNVSYDPSSKLVVGEADIIPTAHGKDLQEIIRAGGKVGISARGFGTTAVGEHAGQKGNIVQEDYQLVTYDFVIGQSTRGAVVTNFEEQARLLAGLTEDEDMAVELKDLTFESLKTARPDLITKIEQAVSDKMKTEMTKTVADAVAEKTADIEKNLLLRLEVGSDGKIRKDGEVIKLKKDAGGRGGDRGEQDPKDHVCTEEQFKEFAKTLGYKIEKKSKKSADEDDEDEMDEQKLREQAKKLGLTVVKGDTTLESELTKVQKTLTEVTATCQTLTKTQQEMREANQRAEVSQYVFEVTKGKGKMKNALTERLLKLNCKTKEEVDAHLPKEEASLTKVLLENSGGSGITEKGEEIGNSNGEEKKFKTEAGTILTESQVRQRELAGIKGTVTPING